MVPIAHSPRTERDSMWIGDRIYFVSDRDDTLNLYRCDLDGDNVEQLTDSTAWDVRWASSDNAGRIVYESGGELEIYDLAAGAPTRIAIRVPDDGIHRRPARVSAAGQIEDFELSPRGERALFVARGDVFTAPIENGPARNLTRSSDAHDRWARWSPDGGRIAFVSDRSGEDQVYVVDQHGSSPPEPVTQGLEAMLYAPAWSPDGERLAFSDKHGRLFVVRLADRRMVEVADDEYGRIHDYSWSPDGAWLAFSLSGPNRWRSIWIWSVADGELRRATDGPFDEYRPTWDANGDYLYYLSEREFAPQISAIEWNFAGNRMTGIFALALRRDVGHPFPAESDEVTVDEPKSAAKSAPESGRGDRKSDAANETTDEGGCDRPVRIDFDGLGARVAAVAIEADNISGLAAVPGFLVYSTYGAPYYGRRSDTTPKLRIYDLEKRKASVLVEDADGWAVSPDGSKVLVREGGTYRLRAAKPNGSDSKPVATAGLWVDRVPAVEWATIFDEIWRRYRDFF